MMAKADVPRREYRRVVLRIFLGLLMLSVVCLLASFIIRPVRVLFLFTSFIGIVTGLLYFPKSNWLCSGALTLMLLCCVWMIAGQKPIDAEALRMAYRARLLSYTGTYYLLGGETHIAIDCSGLARMALWEAMLARGIVDRNPRLLGTMPWTFWWRDIGVAGMENGAYGYTHVIDKTDRLATYDHADLLIGDMAVANHGKHLLIYLGDQQWIEASSLKRHVIINRATPKATHIWLTRPVVLLRWWVLEDGETL
ncbi:MAG: NlpC/P60 family protein [Armatimonadota bacterium]